MKIIIVAAATLCGRISPAPLASAKDRKLLEQLRQDTDAGIIGASTLREENPEMLGRQGCQLPERFRAVITYSGSIPWRRKKLFEYGRKVIIFTRETNLKMQTMKYLSEFTTVVGLPEQGGTLSLAAALDYLQDEGVRSLLVEGGGKLNYAFLQERLADELYVTITPQISGDKSAASLAAGKSPLGRPFLPLKMIECKSSAAGEIFARYRVMKQEK